MSVDALVNLASDSAHKAGDKSHDLDHLHGARTEAMAAAGKVEPKSDANLPKGFGQLILTGKDDDKDIGKLIFKKDGQGGETCEGTTAEGIHYTSSARPDGQGGVIEVHTDSDPNNNYTAHFNKDGSLKVDWQNGNHMERSKDKNGVARTTMTGPKADDNYNATQANGETSVQYADGSSWQRKDSSEEFHAGSTIGGIIDKIGFDFGLGSRTDKTFWELNSGFWLSRSKLVTDVMDSQTIN